MSPKETLLYRITELMFEKQQTFLLLDELYEDEVISPFVRNIQIDSPYQQLLFDGVLSQYNHQNEIVVSFTIEAYFHHLLAKVLQKDERYKTAESLLELIQINKLVGLKEGVSNLFCFDNENENFSRLTNFIDLNKNVDLYISTKPLIQIIERKGSEFTLDLLLRNESNNDFEILTIVSKYIDLYFPIEKCIDFYNIVRQKIIPDSLPKIILIIKTIQYLENKNERVDELKNIERIIFNISLTEFSDIYLILARQFDFLYQPLKTIELINYSTNLVIKFNINDDEIMAEHLNGLGSIFLKQDDYNQALLYYNKTLKLLTKKNIKSLDIKASCYSNLGLVYKGIGDYEKSIEHLRQAAILWLSLYGSFHHFVARAYLNLGVVFTELDDFQNSEIFLKKALRIFMQIFKEFNETTGLTYLNLGILYFKNKQLEKALFYSEEAIMIFENINNEIHPLISRAYSVKGKILTNLHKFDEAILFINKSITIELQIRDENHFYLGNLFDNFGDIFFKMRNLEKSQFYYEKALKVFLDFYGLNHPSVELMFYKLGKVFRGRKQLRKAIASFRNSLKVSFEIDKSYQYSTISSWSNIFFIFLKINKKYEAFKIILIVVDIEKEALEEKDDKLIKRINQTIQLAKQLNKENELPDWIKNYKTE